MKLGFFEILTLILVVAKLAGYNDMTWLQVSYPYIIGTVIGVLGSFAAERKINRMTKRGW